MRTKGFPVFAFRSEMSLEHTGNVYETVRE
jgi:hypothetical protein